jgi:hypothetical protein
MPNLPYTAIDADGHVHERDDQLRDNAQQCYSLASVTA